MWPVGQRLPQPPQLRSSTWVSEQMEPTTAAAVPVSRATPPSGSRSTSQRAYIGPHSTEHAPSEHTRPAAHARPQAPQWPRSVWTLTQFCPQRSWPVGQAPRQRPLTHIWSLAQAKPQVPQLAGSALRSRQVPRQAERGASQTSLPRSVVLASVCGTKRVSVGPQPCASAKRTSAAKGATARDDDRVGMEGSIVRWAFMGWARSGRCCWPRGRTRTRCPRGSPRWRPSRHRFRRPRWRAR